MLQTFTLNVCLYMWSYATYGHKKEVLRRSPAVLDELGEPTFTLLAQEVCFNKWDPLALQSGVAKRRPSWWAGHLRGGLCSPPSQTHRHELERKSSSTWMGQIWIWMMDEKLRCWVTCTLTESHMQMKTHLHLCYSSKDTIPKNIWMPGPKPLRIITWQITEDTTLNTHVSEMSYH